MTNCAVGETCGNGVCHPMTVISAYAAGAVDYRTRTTKCAFANGSVYFQATVAPTPSIAEVNESTLARREITPQSSDPLKTFAGADEGLFVTSTSIIAAGYTADGSRGSLVTLSLQDGSLSKYVDFVGYGFLGFSIENDVASGCAGRSGSTQTDVVIFDNFATRTIIQGAGGPVDFGFFHVPGSAEFVRLARGFQLYSVTRSGGAMQILSGPVDASGVPSPGVDDTGGVDRTSTWDGKNVIFDNGSAWYSTTPSGRSVMLIGYFGRSTFADKAAHDNKQVYRESVAAGSDAIYWVETADPDWRIRTIAKAGGGPVTTVASSIGGGAMPRSLFVNGKFLYWIARDGRLLRINL